MSNTSKIVGKIREIKIDIPGMTETDVEKFREEAIQEIEAQNAEKRSDVWKLLIQKVTLNANESDQAEDAIEIEKNKHAMEIYGFLLTKLGRQRSWDEILDSLTMPEGYLKLFRLIGVKGDEWKSSWVLRNRADTEKAAGGLGLMEEQASIAAVLPQILTKKFGSYRTFVAKMEGKEDAEPTNPKKVDSCKTAEDLLFLFKENNITLEMFDDLNQATAQKGDRTQIIRKVVKKFVSVDLLLLFVKKLWTPDENKIQQFALFDKSQFLNFFHEASISGFWKDKNRLIKIAQEEINQKLTPNKGLGEFLMAINSRFKSYEKFKAWIEPPAKKIESWNNRVSKCKAPLDFLVLFIDQGVPTGKWESGEWMSMTAKKSVEEGGINNNLSGFVNAIRADDRFESYPKFVAWMHGKEEVEIPASRKVMSWTDPEQAKALYRELEIPEDYWLNVDRMAALAKDRRDTGIGKKGVWGVVQAIGKRWETTREYYAWFLRKGNAEDTMRDKVEACENRDQLLQLFKTEGILDDKWRNSYWLGIGSRLPKEQGGIGKNLRSLRNALTERFGNKWTTFLRYMDGLPKEGITSDEVALSIIQKESERLTVPLSQLLDPYEKNGVVGHWRKSPLLVDVLDYFSKKRTSETELPVSISSDRINQELEFCIRKIRSKKNNSGLSANELGECISQIHNSWLDAAKNYVILENDEDMEELCQELDGIVKEIVKAKDINPNFARKIIEQRREFLRNLTTEARWNLHPLRKYDKLTTKGLDALNDIRAGVGMEKIFGGNDHFLREGISEEEKNGLAAVAAELGPAAVAEYYCALYPDRFPYNYRTIQNLRAWLGDFETRSGLGVEQIPPLLLTTPKLATLKLILFNRLRDKYHALYQQGLDVVREKLESSKAIAAHDTQKTFAQDLVDYFSRTEKRDHPIRLKKSVKGGVFPANHQKIAITEIEKQRSCLNADVMGGGKTGSTIAAFEHLRDQGKAKRALILCPAQIVPVWRKALSDSEDGCFEEGNKPNAVIIESGNKDWVAAKQAEYVVMSIEMARHNTDGKSHEELAKELEADFFVLDEAHNVKNPDGEDTDRIFRMSQTPSTLNGYLTLLTGTPIPNTLRDLAAQIRLLYAGREEIDGVNIQDVNLLANSIMRGHPLMVRNLLLPKMLRRTSEQSLPVDTELHREVVTDQLSPVEQAIYDSIRDCPFYEATEKIHLLRLICLRSETKYQALRTQVDDWLLADDTSVSPKKITIASSWFAKGVTRDFQNDHDVETSNAEEYIVGRLRKDYEGTARVFVLDGNNSRHLESIIQEFRECSEPALLVTLTSVAGEGLDLSFSSHSVVLAPTQTVSEEDQWGKRQHRKGQERDVYLRVLQMLGTIEQGIGEYAERKYRLIEEVLHGRPLSELEEEFLQEDAQEIKNRGALAYEVMSPKQKVKWIFKKLYGRGKEYVREFFELNNGKYARDFAEFYPLEEETSYQGNNARLITALIEPELQDENVQIADIGCGCLMMQRMLADRGDATVWSSDICSQMLEAGKRLSGKEIPNEQIHEGSMDELAYEDESKDIAILSLNLHYTRHNPRKTTGNERIRTLQELNRILRMDGTAIISLPTRVFDEIDKFRNFCSVLERQFGFQIVPEKTDLAHSADNAGESPFEAFVITLKKVGRPNYSALPVDDLEALSFKNLTSANGSNGSATPPKEKEVEENGMYHEEFELGGSRLQFRPITSKELADRDNRKQEKEKFTRVEERINALITTFGSIKNIPEAMLLSISLENVNSTDQADRDEYFKFLLEYYGSIQRIPVNEISNNSPVILIRNESKRGPFLCLGRIDDKSKKPCGYGKKYFYEEALS